MQAFNVGSPYENMKFIQQISRIHEMTPKSTENLENFILEFNNIKKYTLFAGEVKNNNLENIYLEKGIQKKKINIKNAEELEENDVDIVVIKRKK